MKTLRHFIHRLVLGAALGALPATALPAIDLVGHDTDLFTVNPNIPSQVPNVLLILDNTANFSNQANNWPALIDPTCNFGANKNTQGDAQLCALYKTLGNLDEQINVGLMEFNDNVKGGYVRFPMSPMTVANKTALQTIVRNIAVVGQGVNTPAEKASQNSDYDGPLNDAFRYFNSLGTFTGVAGDVASTADLSAYNADKTAFKFPASTNSTSCGTDYIIFIGNTFPKAALLTPAIDNTAALLNDPSVVVDKSVLNNLGNQARSADNWTKFLYYYGVKLGAGLYRPVTTYALDVCKDACDANQAILLASMAKVSQGKYIRATNLEAIEVALKTVFAEVQAVNSVFAATTLPVSINVRGTNLNQVYIGVFRPDPTLSPRWLGNLKHYKLGVTNAASGQLSLVDADDAVAVNLNTGFITNTATSIWTERQGDPAVATDGFWGFRPTYPQTDVGRDEDLPDGDLVEKGGAAQKIRQFYKFPDSITLNADGSSMVRSIYTCTGACAAGAANSPNDELKNFLFNLANTAGVTAQKLGTLSTATVDSITGSGTTATVTINAGHSFVGGNQVVISGATPAYYNGTFAVKSSSPAPTATTFGYTVTPSPNPTVDTTSAYVTLPGYTLVPGVDKVTVSGATPLEYNVTANAIAAVVGNVNQFSYSPITSTTAPAAGSTVTAVRGVTSLIYTSTTGRITATVPKHGFTANTAGSAAVNPNIVIAGATPAEFNGTYATVQNVQTNSFEYTPGTIPAGGSVTTAVAGPIPAGVALTAGSSIVQVAGSTATSYNTATCTTSSASNVTAVDSVNSTFTYSPGGAVTGTAAGTITVQNCVKADLDTYAVVGTPTIGAGGDAEFITVTLNTATATSLVSGQTIKTSFAIGDKVAIKGVTCVPQGAGTRVCSTTTTTPSPTDAVFTITLTAVNNAANTITFDAGGNVNSVTVSSPQVFWTGLTLSPAATLTSVVQGSSTVNATGTITATKSGDLTGSVTSITSQGTATGNITAALATSGDPAERDNLIKWVRGLDNQDNENNSSGAATDIRAYVHGDVLHSRPAVVNYNRSSGENDVYIFYGTNDGMLRAIKGGSLATGGGKEQWAFIPPEFFGKLKRLRDQTPTISSNTPRDYGFDGPITVYTFDSGVNPDGRLDHTQGDKVYLFIGMRRGGRMYYALDVSNPLDPKLLWKKGCPNATGTSGCDSRFGEIGQTWSEPKLGYLRNWPNTLALMFAAGNDDPVEVPQPCFVTNWDSAGVQYRANATIPTPMDTTTCPGSTGTATTKSRSMGRGVFILNAVTGNVLWRAGPGADNSLRKQVTGMTYAMPGDLAVLRNRSNTAARANTVVGTESVPTGYIDRIYAADTGGNVWRIDVANDTGDESKPDFAVSKLASIAIAPVVGSHAALNYRKFLFSPDVVYASGYDAVLLGSGDREHPFDAVVKNRFYMFKDKNIGTILEADITSLAAPTTGIITDATGGTDLFDVTSNCIQDASKCTGGQTPTSAKADLAAAKGWKLLYDANPGEKTIATATTTAGTVIFNTNQPKSTQDAVSGSLGACVSDLGTARQYGVSYQDATATYIFGTLPSKFVPAGGRLAVFAGGGFLPQPVPVVVQIGGKYYQTVIAGVQTTNPGGLKLQSRVRTYWYRKVD